MIIHRILILLPLNTFLNMCFFTYIGKLHQFRKSTFLYLFRKCYKSNIWAERWSWKIKKQSRRSLREVCGNPVIVVRSHLKEGQKVMFRCSFQRTMPDRKQLSRWHLNFLYYPDILSESLFFFFVICFRFFSLVFNSKFKIANFSFFIAQFLFIRLFFHLKVRRRKLRMVWRGVVCLTFPGNFWHQQLSFLEDPAGRFSSQHLRLPFYYVTILSFSVLKISHRSVNVLEISCKIWVKNCWYQYTMF